MIDEMGFTLISIFNSLEVLIYMNLFPSQRNMSVSSLSLADILICIFNDSVHIYAYIDVHTYEFFTRILAKISSINLQSIVWTSSVTCLSPSPSRNIQ